MENLTNQEAIPAMTAVERTVNVFNAPEKAFIDINRYPTWLFPLMLILVSSLAFMYVTHDLQASFQKKIIMDSERFTEEQKDQILEGMDNPSFLREYVVPMVGVSVTVFAIPAILAGIFMLFGNFVFGGAATYKNIFSVTAWAGLIGIVEMIVKVPLMLAKETMEVYTSLAVLMDASLSKTWLFQLLNIVDIFTIWKIIVFGLAFSVVFKLSKNKSYATLSVLYVVFAVISIILTRLISF